MAAHRYWRAIALSSLLGPLQLSQFQLRSSGGRVDTSAGITSSAAPTSGTLTDLQGTTTTPTVEWSAAAAAVLILQWDFGGSPQDIVDIRLGSAASYYTFLRGLRLDYSDDGVTWTMGLRYASVMWPGPRTLTSSSVAAYGTTALLLHGDGADGSTTITDSSTTPKTVTNTGVVIRTAQSMFGGASMAFDTTLSNKLSIPHSADLSPLGDHCIQCWVWMATVTGAASTRVILYKSVSSGFTPYALYVNQPGFAGVIWYNSAGSGALGTINSRATITAGTWFHMAATRRSGVHRMYIDGELQGQFFTTDTPYFNAAHNVQVGNTTDNLYPIGRDGTSYIDELSIVDGDAVYNGPFTVPSGPGNGTGVFQDFPNVGSASVVGGRVATNAYPTVSKVIEPRVFRLRGDMRTQQPGLRYNGTITGTVKQKASPTNIPLRRVVRLYDDVDGSLVAQTWSDAITGVYTFTEINETRAYTALSLDYTHNFRAEAADNLTPTIMP